MSPAELTQRRMAAAQALARIGGESYWTKPDGEPEWVEIPAGEFWMGSEEGFYDNEKPLHKLYLDTFLIARTPITNAQYHLFVQDTSHEAPLLWEDNRPPRGLESHPVVSISWHDAQTYCRWLTQQLTASGRLTALAAQSNIPQSNIEIRLPSEAEWEKAARGSSDKRVYPWVDTFKAARANCVELGLNNTTPVGIFPNGTSPYGCLDMAGNVWEWTRSLWGPWDEQKSRAEPEFSYPYDPTDGRENLAAGDEVQRVVRGGGFFNGQFDVRCAARDWGYPVVRGGGNGFRVVLSPF